jgi:hypothetical protein
MVLMGTYPHIFPTHGKLSPHIFPPHGNIPAHIPNHVAEKDMLLFQREQQEGSCHQSVNSRREAAITTMPRMQAALTER